MGASASVDLRPEEVAELQDITACACRARRGRAAWPLCRRRHTHSHCLLLLARVRRAPRCSTHNCAADEPKEIKALYKRFRRLDRSGRGTLSNDDLQMIPEIAMNPLSARLQVLFVKDGEDRINFKSFVSALAIFSDKARPDLKTRGACPCGSERAGGRNGGGGRRRRLGLNRSAHHRVPHLSARWAARSRVPTLRHGRRRLFGPGRPAAAAGADRGQGSHAHCR